MKTYIYDVERGYFTNSAGGALGIVPTLVYGEQAAWKFFLKTATGTVYSLADVTELTAAAGVAGGETVAATTEGITVNVTAGTVTVPMNCLTPEFQAAVQGKPNGVYGFYELTGYDAAQGKILYIRFNVLLNEVVNPDITTIPGLADQILAVVSSGGYVTSDGVTEVVDEAVSSGGFIASGAEFSTTVGPYTVALTSGGGVAVSGSGASVLLSGGAITASVDNESMCPSVLLSGGVARLNVYHSTFETNAGIVVDAEGGNGDGGVDIYTPNDDSGVTVNGSPLRIITSTDTSTTSAAIPVLSGGTSFIYTQPLTSLTVASVVKTTEASFVHFTLDSVTAPTPVVISGYTFDSGRFEGGKEYLVGFFDGMAVVNEVTSGGVLQ